MMQLSLESQKTLYFFFFKHTHSIPLCNHTSVKAVHLPFNEFVTLNNIINVLCILILTKQIKPNHIITAKNVYFTRADVQSRTIRELGNLNSFFCAQFGRRVHK